MDVVTVSPKFQVVIPRAIREALHIKPGQKIQALHYGDRIELVPQRSIKSARGMLRGLNTDVQREKSDERR